MLVGLDTSDDAGVYRLNRDQAIVQTVDFFTPVVDDPYAFGQVAAANALSDIYAMGAKPLTVLNLVSFPVSKLDMSVLAQILQGGSEKIREAGAQLIGGHSIDDNEPKYGLAVTGLVHPDKILSNARARVGDYLVLTKPLGVGIITTGIKRGIVAPEDVAEVTRVMATLNKDAAEAATETGVHACTDITGFGLLGHLHEMMKASGTAAEVYAGSVPVLPAVWGCLEQGALPGGTKSNRRYLEDKAAYEAEVEESRRWVLSDAITSGGLLLSVGEEDLPVLMRQLRQRQTPAAAVVGRVIRGEAGRIKVRPE
ncbi:selenide, water dikinase [Acididesulfobacillus acetoxydans]|uniref:Selenide, water dikinase n=1 Tax=Acididesulfobacillus acetoxydans TaxID=1561005 RepID=A0A8S0VYD3_9FIRM|nr:selenide, water dikinase [Acididesulfobacillus acetoxydans]CEJ05815.1 Selenide, water dikinase [Acididesulfobacillus acetoxydans]